MNILHASLVVLLLGASAPASAQNWRGDVNLLLAGKSLDHHDWGSTDQQGELGIQTNWEKLQWPVTLAADFLASGKDADISENGFTRQRARTSEIDLGVRTIWRRSPYARPYLGGGIALASAELTRSSPGGDVSERDGGIGFWFGGGIDWVLSRSFNVGFDAKVSAVRVRLLGNDVNAGGFHLGMLAGYHWGD